MSSESHQNLTSSLVSNVTHFPRLASHTVLLATSLTQFQIPDWEGSDLTSDSFLLYFVPRGLKFVYYITIVYALCSNLKVVSHTTALAVLGTR